MSEFISKVRKTAKFQGGPRDGEQAEYKRGDAGQQAWQSSVWCYVKKDGGIFAWTEVPEKLRATRP